MTLDLTKIAGTLTGLASETANRESKTSLDELADAYLAVDTPELKRRVDAAKTSWLLARPSARFQATEPAPAPPADYSVVASDGSFILPDRHAPARYFIINIGKVVLRYGSDPYAEIDAEPSMFFREEELYVPAEVRRIPVSGTVLGFKRAAEELSSVAEVAIRQTTPSIAIQDGTLILWGLETQADSVQHWVLDQFLGALNLLRDHEVPVASYISAPASKNVVHSLRVWRCDYPLRGEPVNCDDCHFRTLTQQHVPACQPIPDVDDRFVFDQVAQLPPGERSQIFVSKSKILDRYGPDHVIHFFYLNSGTEIGRVEIPHWVAEDRDKLELVHATIYEQCTLGRGYPSALQEAHEIAAIRPDERQAVEALVEQALADHLLPGRRSGKAESKRVRFI